SGTPRLLAAATRAWPGGTPQLISVNQRPRRSKTAERSVNRMLGRLRRHGAVVGLAEQAAPLGRARITEAVQLVAGQRGDPGDVEVVVFRHRDGAQRGGEPE